MKKQYTDEDEAKVIEYHSQGMTYMAIADVMDIDLRSVHTILKKHGIVKPKQYSGRVLTSEDKADIIRMYKDGYRQSEIAAAYGKHFSSIRHILVESGALYDGGKDLKEKERTREYVNTSNSVRSLLSAAILPADIDDMRRRVKVGDRITVRSLKAGDNEATLSGTGGIRRRAKVVDVNHPRFLTVKLPGSGALEMILWRDLVLAERAAERRKQEAERAKEAMA